MFFRSVLSIFRSALRCAFVYFFTAFCCFLLAFWEARDCGMFRVRICAEAETHEEILNAPSKIKTERFFINVPLK